MQTDVIYQEVVEPVQVQAQVINDGLQRALDSLAQVYPPTFIEVEKQPFSLTETFVNGGLGGMIIITLFLIALLVAAWKAPRWVKEIGIGALIFSIFWMVLGLSQACDDIQMTGDASPVIVFGALKLMLIPLLYGLLVYFISLIIRIIHKPRI